MGRGLDYYAALGLARSADDVEIKKAFRRLALKHHPDVAPADRPEAGGSAAEFVRVCEAYDVLSSAKAKGTYDLYGEDVLKSTEQGGGSYTFDPVSGPQAVFSRFFGTANPYEALSSLATHFEGLTTRPKPRPGKQQEYDLLVPLEELYRGCVKKVSHTRSVTSEDGTVALEQRSLEVHVKPGELDGTRFVFQGEGDVAPGVRPGAVVVVLGSAPHPHFRRQLADLVSPVQLPLLQALTGGIVSVAALDGRVLSVALDEIVAPGLKMRVPGEGMPTPGGVRGDLLLEFELVMPACLSQQQKMLLRAALYLPAKPSQAQDKALWAFEGAFKDPRQGWSTGIVRPTEGGGGSGS